MVVTTDFARFSHQQLYAMLQAGEEQTVRKAAHSWHTVGDRLHDQANNLEHKLTKFKQHWQGGAAEQYQVMVGDLSTGLRQIGDAAYAIRNIAHDSADALVKAQRDMPPPVTVPEMSATTLQLATTPLQLDGFASPDAAARIQQQQADAVTALRDHQQATAASNAAHAKAVAVMRELAGVYHQADQSIPRTPDADRPPGVPSDDGTLLPPGVPPEPGDGTEKPTGKPVFGNMFTAGLAAASAASAGRLGMPILPKVPGWAAKKRNEQAKTEPAKSPTAASGTGFGGGAGKIGGGGGFGGVAAPPVPTGHPGMAGGPTAAAAALRAAAGAAGAAGVGSGMMPFMPFMPFAPTGDMAGARRLPPWLLETEEVWGESSVITPPVVGEEPPDDPDPSIGYSY